MSPYQRHNDVDAPLLTPQGQQYIRIGHGMAEAGSNLRVVNNAPTLHVNAQAPLTQVSLASLNNNTIARPPPLRDDSGAPGPHAAYLAGHIKNGDADNPFDLDCGSSGPSK